MGRLCFIGVLMAASCAAQSGTPIPSTFFAMTSTQATDYPKVNIGTLAHPSNFAWVWIERSRGTFNFQIFDNYVADAQQHGLIDTATNTVNMAITLGTTPGWAVADKSTCTQPNGQVQCTAAPDNLQDWTDFLTALIQHYNGKTQPHIRYYELWNEANARNFWSGTYAQMVALGKAAYPIIHQDPYSKLLTPSVAGPVGTASPMSGVTWMTNYLQAGGFQYADGGAFHGYIGQTGVTPYPMPEEDSTPGCKPFVTCFGSIITKATQMRAVFDQNGLAGKPMFQTEGSWGNANITDPDTQVAWLARWYLLQAGLRSSLNLQMSAWYTWGGGSAQTWGDIETSSLQPTDAALAYDQVYNWLLGAVMTEPCAAGAGGVWTCTLTRPNGYVAQAVWNTQGSSSYTPGPGYTQYRDLSGATVPLTGKSVTIGSKPILIEGTVAGTGALIDVSAASYNGSPLAVESLAAAFGANLAGSIVSAQSATLPTTLGTTQVLVTDSANVTRAAPLLFVAPGQINYLVPAGTAAGTATVSVSVNGGVAASGSIAVSAVAPGLFTANGSGQGVPAASAVTAASRAPVYQCGSAALSCVPAPIDVSVPTTVELYGTGIRNRSALSNVKCTIGGVAVPVNYAGPQGQYPGLDQVNVQLPPSLAGMGETDLVLVVDGITANPVRINVQ